MHFIMLLMNKHIFFINCGRQQLNNDASYFQLSLFMCREITIKYTLQPSLEFERYNLFAIGIIKSNETFVDLKSHRGLWFNMCVLLITSTLVNFGVNVKKCNVQDDQRKVENCLVKPLLSADLNQSVLFASYNLSLMLYTEFNSASDYFCKQNSSGSAIIK